MRARWLGLMAAMFLLPFAVEAQSGRVALTGTVSETVAVSVLPNSTQGDVNAEVLSSGNTVRITLSGDDVKSHVIRVPLLVRSNSGFKISAAVESKAAVLTQLSVTDVRATGTLVSPLATSGLNVPVQSDLSLPFVIASGPRVSLGGTLTSPNNALEITLLIGLKPEPTPGWLIHLTLVGSGESRLQ